MTRFNVGNTYAFKHGQSNPPTPTYTSWRNMLSRCRNRNRSDYVNYGGRGITVCERWLAFENFLVDMGERPAGTTLDRKDNDRGYDPTNCVWATHKEQTNNRRPFKHKAPRTKEHIEKIRAAHIKRNRKLRCSG